MGLMSKLLNQITKCQILKNQVHHHQNTATNQLLNMKRPVRKDQVVDQVVIAERTNQMAVFQNQIVTQNQDQKPRNQDHHELVTEDRHQIKLTKLQFEYRQHTFSFFVHTL